MVSKFVPLAVTAMGVWDERSLRWLLHFSDVCAAASASNPGTVFFSSLMTRRFVGCLVAWQLAHDALVPNQ